MTPTEDVTTHRLTKPLIFFMSLAVGIIVANLYYFR
jgi:hypothetical protein